jgi:flagellar biosynthesis/type III secretory pathway M-ring protein FliF/YscJ
MVPVLAQDMSFEELDAAEEALTSAGIDYQRFGRRLHVKPAEQSNAIRILNKADALPQDTSTGFEALIQDDSPFRPESENAFRRRVALGNELAKVIASGPNIAAARVFITMETKRRIGMPNTVPTASVHVRMARSHTISQSMVEGFARLVAGAVPGLKPHDVNVIANDRPYGVPDPDDAWAADMLDRKKQEEGHYLSKIRDSLSYIPGVLAAVAVELDGAKKRTESHTWAKPVPKVEESRKSKTTDQQSPGETGTNPNVGAALGSAGSARGSEDQERKTEFYDTKPSETVVSEHPPFTIKRITAAISIPRSFFVSIFKAQPGNETTEPTDGDQVFEALRNSEIDRVRNLVKNIIMAESDDDVKVVSFYDFEPGTAKLRGVPGGVVQAGVGDASGYVDMAKGYIPQVGLVLLALFCLLTVIRMVRKTTRAASAIPSPQQGIDVVDEHMAGPDGVLHVAGLTPVGQAEMPDGMLEGQEVDDDTLRFKQLGEQVSRMVDDSPQVAADLLRRWVDAD